jgi:hypothetical protein
LVIANLIDEPTGENRLYNKILSLADEHKKQRIEDMFFNDSNMEKLYAIHTYMKKNRLTITDFIVGEDLRDFVVEWVQPNYYIRTKDISQLLNRNGFREERKMRYVIVNGEDVQRICFRIKAEELAALFKKYDDCIEPPDPEMYEQEAALILNKMERWRKNKKFIAKKRQEQELKGEEIDESEL